MRQGNEEAGIATAAELWENRDKRMGPSNSATAQVPWSFGGVAAMIGVGSLISWYNSTQMFLWSNQAAARPADGVVTGGSGPLPRPAMQRPCRQRGR
jgi:hypothetical protein